MRPAQRNGVFPFAGKGYFDPATVPLDPETGEGVPYAAYAYACHVALVTVDVFTGEVVVHKIIAAHDVGRAIHPEAVVGQIRGGVAMGVGFALMEEYDPATTRSMKEYHIPTSMDMPEVVPIIVESPETHRTFRRQGGGRTGTDSHGPGHPQRHRKCVGETYLSPARQPGTGS